MAHVDCIFVMSWAGSNGAHGITGERKHMVREDFRTIVPWWTQPAEHNPYDGNGRTQGENPVRQGPESGGV